jgi:hypothetical protein
MKTKKTESTASPASDPVAAHFALVALLDQFGLCIDDFLSLGTQSYEHKIAAHSLPDLKEVYCLLLKPGKSLQSAAAECPAWPSGKFARRQPAYSTLRQIKNRLLQAVADETPGQKPLTEPEIEQRKIQLESGEFRLREKNLQLKNRRLNLARRKFAQQSAPASPSEPALPVSQETPRQMIKRVYGYNPFPK